MKDKIIIKGAREHNLKNIDLEIPKNKLVVITGLSGSGKSSLAFDTIYAEGQRRYVESLSAYARQFLGLMNKPDLDSIDGLSPAISIEQKTTSKNPRSTVGTVTEIYDYLRLIFARIGTAHCPKCNSKLEKQTAENITEKIMKQTDKKIVILSPIIIGQKGHHEKIFDKLLKDGFTKVRVDSEILEIEEAKKTKLGRYEKHWIEAVIDRVKITNENKTRISDSIEQGLKYSNEKIIILDIEIEKEFKNNNKVTEINRGVGEKLYTTFGACPNHPEIVFEELEPRHFSFNSPFGACPNCHGLGAEMKISPDLICPDKNLSIMDGAIKIYKGVDGWRMSQLKGIGTFLGFDLFTKIKDLTDDQYNKLMYGFIGKYRVDWNSGNYSEKEDFEGLVPQTERLFNETESDYRKKLLEKFFTKTKCKVCNGKRLKEEILSVKIKNKSIIDITDMSINDAYDFFINLKSKLNKTEIKIANIVLKEIIERLEFLINVGLNYLNLSRSAGTLSGGEAQRIRLATQIGSNLSGVLYILDEPSIGLHQRDNEKLIGTLKKLRDIGNTLIVVEHDEDTMKESDYLIDIGPGAGIHGGNIIAKGTPKEVMKNKNSLTGQYLAGKIKIEIPKTRRNVNM
jgi:excinuclease ABC subunit A